MSGVVFLLCFKIKKKKKNPTGGTVFSVDKKEWHTSSGSDQA